MGIRMSISRGVNKSISQGRTATLFMRSIANVLESVTGSNETISYSFLEVGDEVIAILVLLQASERHLCSRNVLGG